MNRLRRSSVTPFVTAISSNINEVIRAVLNSLFIYLFIYFFAKRLCTHKKHQKHQKAKKSTKKHKNAIEQKHKNANKRTKIKNALKKASKEKKVTYSLICVFVLAKKKKYKSLYNGNVGPTKLIKVLSDLYKQKLVY